MQYVIVVLAIALAIAGYFSVRYFLLKRSLNKVNGELREVIAGFDTSRITRLPSPDKNLEELLETINTILDLFRTQALEFIRKEDTLKSQIEFISHDLRTPLTSIQGYLSFIDTSNLDHESLEAIEVIQRKANSLQRLIFQFYELSQVEHDGTPLEVQRYDVAHSLRHTLAAHYRLLIESGLSVTTVITENPVEALVNPDALGRILANLIENASRYALSSMHVEMHEGSEYVCIIVRNDSTLPDTIDPEDLFAPFYTCDASRTKGSSGLGLTIARRLAEGMNAQLEAKLVQNSSAQQISFYLNMYK